MRVGTGLMKLLHNTSMYAKPKGYVKPRQRGLLFNTSSFHLPEFGSAS